MNILRYSLFILLLFSTPSYAEPLAHIEETLALRIDGVEKNEPQDSDAVITDTDSENPQVKVLPPPSTSLLDLDRKIRMHSDENFSHPFSVQVGASRSKKLCYRVASMLRKVGYPAFSSSIELNNRGIWHRVYIGAFTTRDAAQKVKEQLFAESIGEGFIRHLPFAVQVGTSGNSEHLKPLHETLLASSHLPYATSIRNGSSGVIEGRLLIGACYERQDCDLLLSIIIKEGFNAVIVER